MNVAHSARRTPLLWALPLAALAGWVLARLHAPLPWMTGPLLTIAIANGLHARIEFGGASRNVGQWLIGSALGLYFTAPVIEQVISLWGWIALSVIATMASSILAAYALTKYARVDRATAYFASAVGGAAEMANLAERHGARTDQVAAAQAIRVLLVVLIVPGLYQLAGIHGADPYAAASIEVNPWGLFALLAGTLAASAGLAALRLPNAWLLGALFVSTILTGIGAPPSAVPAELVNFGQYLIGMSLGARFSPEFFRNSPRFLWSIVTTTTAVLIACSAVGALIGEYSGIAIPTAILSTVPGGIAEMGITAGVLKLGVPIVTAFHAVRLLAVVAGAEPLYRLMTR